MADAEAAVGPLPRLSSNPRDSFDGSKGSDGEGPRTQTADVCPKVLDRKKNV